VGQMTSEDTYDCKTVSPPGGGSGEKGWKRKATVREREKGGREEKTLNKKKKGEMNTRVGKRTK